MRGSDRWILRWWGRRASRGGGIGIVDLWVRCDIGQVLALLR